jgi:hypothetical protein
MYIICNFILNQLFFHVDDGGDDDFDLRNCEGIDPKDLSGPEQLASKSKRKRPCSDDEEVILNVVTLPTAHSLPLNATATSQQTLVRGRSVPPKQSTMDKLWANKASSSSSSTIDVLDMSQVQNDKALVPLTTLPRKKDDEELQRHAVALNQMGKTPAMMLLLEEMSKVLYDFIITSYTFRIQNVYLTCT